MIPRSIVKSLIGWAAHISPVLELRVPHVSILRHVRPLASMGVSDLVDPSFQYGLALCVSSGQLSERKGVAGKPAPL